MKNKTPKKKTTTKTQAKKQATAAPIATAIKATATSATLEIAKIAHAPWNPRTPEEMSTSHPAMKELASSIASTGLINPITVWQCGDSYVCIAGNRRLCAAALAGKTTISATVYRQDDLDEDGARMITRAENEVRFGVSAMADARQIKQLMERGIRQNDIAAIFGVSEATVCRRAKLLDLDEKVLNELEKVTNTGRDIQARALEIIAAHPAELQIAAVKELTTYGSNWVPASVENVFKRLMHKLDSTCWIFTSPGGKERLNRCRVCGKCTGNQPTLFDLEDTDGTNTDDRLGRCMDGKCYHALEIEAKSAAIEEALAKHLPKIKGRVTVKHDYGSPWQDLKANKATPANPFAYIYWNEWNHEARVKFGPDPAIAKKKKDAERTKEKQNEEEQRIKLNTIDEIGNKVAHFMLGVDNIGSEDDDYYARHNGEPFANMKKNLVEILTKHIKAEELIERFATLLLKFDAFEQYDYGSEVNQRWWWLWAIRNIPDVRALVTDDEISALQDYIAGGDEVE